MQPLKGPNGGPDIHDLRRQHALLIYVMREMEGLDTEYIPDKVILKTETQNYYRDLVKQKRAGKETSVWDVFKAPFWISPP